MPVLPQKWPLVSQTRTFTNVAVRASTIQSAAHDGCWSTLLAILCVRCRYTATDGGVPAYTKQTSNKGRPATRVGQLVFWCSPTIICGMSESTTKEFDWSPLGEGFWLDAQKTTGASIVQTRFACCRHQGKTATLSAKLAGYGGEGVNLRGAGHRAAKSNAVMALVQLAQAEQAGGSDGTVSPAESRRILSKLARGADPSVKIRAVELLAKLEREEREFQAQTVTKHDPIEELRLIAQTSPQFAALLAKDNGIPWDAVSAKPPMNGGPAPAPWADEQEQPDAS
jgi:hypothetical protein